MTAMWWIWQIFALLAGLVIGSFLNVCIARWPEDRSVVAPRSHCESCGRTIRWSDNLPVLSWFILRGRCRDCSAPIGAVHPAIELLGGLLSWLLYRRMVPSPEALDPAHLATWGVYFGFVSLLVVASYVDLRHRIVPDQTSIWAVPFGVLGAFLLERLGATDWTVPTWREAVLGAALGGGFFALTALVARILKGQEALGWGDVKLMAMIGAFLGPVPGVLVVMLVGSVVGSIVGIAATLIQRRRTYLPFAPPLALAAVAYVLYGELLVRTFLPAMAGMLD